MVHKQSNGSNAHHLMDGWMVRALRHFEQADSSYIKTDNIEVY